MNKHSILGHDLKTTGSLVWGRLNSPEGELVFARVDEVKL